MNKNKITLLDGQEYNPQNLLAQMEDDSFYYGFCGQTMLSSSAIKELLDGTYFDKDFVHDKKTKERFKAGRLLHMCLLEPDKLQDLAIIAECKTRGHSIYKDLVQEHGVDYVWTRSQWTKMESVRDKVLQDRPEITVDHLHYEVPGLCLIKGIPFRGKADMVSHERKVIVDLKTTSWLDKFPDSAINFSYEIQLYIYCIMFGIDPGNFYWLALCKRTGESKYYKGNQELFEMGMEKTHEAIDIYLDHVA